MQVLDFFIFAPFALAPLISWFFIHRKRAVIGFLSGIILIFLFVQLAFWQQGNVINQCLLTSPFRGSSDEATVRFMCSHPHGYISLAIVGFSLIAAIMSSLISLAITLIYAFRRRRVRNKTATQI